MYRNNEQFNEQFEEQFLAQKIRTQYTEKRTTELDTLRGLDRKVKRPANIFAYLFGSIAAIIMGAGMSLIMTDIGAAIGMEQSFVPGILIGVVGMTMALVNYPIYRGILSARKKKYAPQIIAMSDRIMNAAAERKEK